MGTDASDPLKITRERMSEVAQVWLDFARVKLAPHVEKLPEPVARYVKSHLAGAPATTAGESADAAAS